MILAMPRSIALAAALLAKTLTSPSFALALPVLNLNSPGAENVTVFPDSADKDLYYLSPAAMLVAEYQGVPLFSYTEYGRRKYREALIQTILIPSFDHVQIELAKKRILAIHPAAKFTGIPFSSSQVVFGEILAPFVSASECTHIGGLLNAEQDCSFRLNPLGVAVLRAQFRQNVAITLSMTYTVDGVAQDAIGGYAERRGTYGVAGRIGGPSLRRHPELFHDAWGYPLQIWRDSPGIH